MHFLKKHRYSAIMIGNTLYQGKTGNFYINMKNQKNKEDKISEDILNNSKLLMSLENSPSRSKDRQSKAFQSKNSNNDTLNDNQSFNETLNSESK